MSGSADIEGLMALKAIFSGTAGTGENIGNISNIISAAVPYMPPDKRRAAFYIAKLMEIAEFGNTEVTALETASQDKRTRRDAFLKSVSPYLSDSDKNSIDTLIKIMELKKIMG